MSSTRYLGITVQYNLKWDKHINDITSKGNKALGYFLKAKPKYIKPTNKIPDIPSARQANIRVLMLYMGLSHI